MLFSTVSKSSPDMFSFSIISLSLSKILIACHLFWVSGRLNAACFSIFSIAVSTVSLNILLDFVSIDFAASIAASAASCSPVPFKAEISTTLQPINLDNSFVFITSPFLLTISIMLIATTKGIPNSRSCVVR